MSSGLIMAKAQNGADVPLSSATSSSTASSSLFSFELSVSSFTKVASSSSSASIFVPRICLRLFSYPRLVFDCVDEGVLRLLRSRVDADLLALAADQDVFRHNVDDAIAHSLVEVRRLLPLWSYVAELS